MRFCQKWPNPVNIGRVCDACKQETERANWRRKAAAQRVRKHAEGKQATVSLGRRGTVREYFEVKVARSESGCWEWLGAKLDNGYGTFPSGRRDDPSRSGRAHRWAFEEWRGPIPEGLQLDHTCNNRACVNPWHLDPVTNEENSRRARERMTA